MGAFDDLIPQKAGGGAFDDLIPQQAAPAQQSAPQPLSRMQGISEAGRRQIQTAASNIPIEQREAAVQLELTKGMPEQAAIEQALFRANIPEDLAAARKFASGIPGAIPSIVSSGPAQIAGGIAGLTTAAIPGLEPGAGAAVSEGVRERLTVPPLGQAARRTLQSVGEQLQPIVESIPSAGEKTLEAGGSPGLATLAETAAVAIPELLLGRFGLTKGRGVFKAIDKTSLPSIQKANFGFKSNDLSVGAAQTPKELQRAVVSQNLPIPFEGKSALTKGQVTRNFEQLQFEKETAKQGELGEPLRDRIENQTATLIANFDAIADAPGPIMSELRDIGQGVDTAIKSRLARVKRKVDDKYSAAREAGELREPVEMNTMPEMLEDIERFEGVAPNAVAIRKEAIKRGAAFDDDGALVPGTMTINDAELLRAFVNQATDISNPQQARIRRIAISAIDDATEAAGGDLYKEARKLRSQMATEFENTGITKKLLATKPGSSERSIAYEDVFKKIMLDSPIEEINKLRGTLLRSGPEGKQSWADLKGKGIEYIKQNAQSLSQSDARGNPLLSPDKLNKVIKSMDDQGKLSAIYGKRGAQAIRDLGDLSKDIFTAPPGAINFSNTASALQVALDGLAGFSVTGLPVPVATILKESTKFVKNSKKKAQIRESLDYLKNKRI